MGWISTQTSLTIDEFFKQELAVDQGDEKLLLFLERQFYGKTSKKISLQSLTIKWLENMVKLRIKHTERLILL